ncbi:hypothetical protein [Acidisphaera rubrifaciens]|uniref:Uncharacterized protein n=1 Tax=Acidisphaera rubrifaciens HS-AP3 TaxID=1231350 RepID=A0A0D6P9C7_9PROT|nr:hypothetical protein [Acidisphaera rubrifaciens]GAN77464.1 hypothetical protein Asru_0326_06 [Acidisphaera rubrifaciens HS-AP3]
MPIHPAQPDFFGHAAAVAPAAPDLAVIRRRLHAILDQARAAATTPPWSAQETRVNVLLMRQMSNWLPEDERAALRDAFMQEMDRLRVVPYA